MIDIYFNRNFELKYLYNNYNYNSDNTLFLLLIIKFIKQKYYSTSENRRLNLYILSLSNLKLKYLKIVSRKAAQIYNI